MAPPSSTLRSVSPSPVSESTPLLGESPLATNDGAIVDHGSTNGDSEDKPLPKFQILLLCFARLVEPIAYFGIFPFISEMIKKTGNLEEADVGFYAGFIESMFSLVQMTLMLSWGRAADRIGRKPVLVFSLTGVAFAVAAFGFSRTILQMVLWRCCAGIFAGIVLTVRSMLSENSTPKTQARAFSFFAFSGNLGIFLGPLLGGALADPAKQYESVFGNVQFFKDFPYALPTLVSGGIGLSAAIVCGLFLKETLVRKVVREEGRILPPESPMTTIEIIRSPGVTPVILIYASVMTLGLAYTAICPVFWFTSIEKGGFGWSISQISYFLGGIGIAQAIWLLVIFPPVQRKYGTGNIIRVCLVLWPVFFCFGPIANMFLRRGWTTAFWIMAPITQYLGTGVAMAFTAVQLALNDIAPTPATLGTLNAVALTLVAAIRGVGPALFTSIFAIGVRDQILDGYLVWVLLILLGIAGNVAMRWFPEKAEGKLKD